MHLSGTRNSVSTHNLTRQVIEQETPNVYAKPSHTSHVDDIDDYYDTLADFSSVLSQSGPKEYDDSNTVEEILDPKTAAMKRFDNLSCNQAARSCN